MAEAPVVERSGFAWSRPEVGPAEHSGAYRTFAPKIPAALVATGGVLATIGSLGAWIRAVELKSQSLGPQQVGILWGYSEPSGRALAVIAAITVFIAAVATFTKILPRYSLEAAGLALFAGLLTRIITLDSRSAGIAEAAKQNPNFLAYDAGFAWGAWCILLGLVLVFLGLAVGLLRVIDVRRGLPE